MSFEWVTLEDKYPLSLNSETHWLSLVRGECSDQDMSSYSKDGIFRYSEKPKPSPQFILKQFTNDEGELDATKARSVYAYGRYWRPQIAGDKPYRLEYTAITDSTPSEFVVAGYQDFNEDGDGRIVMLLPWPEGNWVVLKEKCAYILYNANGDGSNMRKSYANYGMGCCNAGSWYSNAVIGGNVVATWNDGGSTKPRHYMWGGRGGAVELSRRVRAYAEAKSADTVCYVNWAENLVIADDLVYDVATNKVYRFSGAGFATLLTRPYKEAHLRNITLQRLAFITDGALGTIKCTVQYGQAEDALKNSDVFEIKITDSNRDKIRHLWTLVKPVTMRVFRLKVEAHGSIGLTQIESYTEIHKDADMEIDNP